MWRIIGKIVVFSWTLVLCSLVVFTGVYLVSPKARRDKYRGRVNSFFDVFIGTTIDLQARLQDYFFPSKKEVVENRA